VCYPKLPLPACVNASLGEHGTQEGDGALSVTALDSRSRTGQDGADAATEQPAIRFYHVNQDGQSLQLGGSEPTRKGDQSEATRTSEAS